MQADADRLREAIARVDAIDDKDGIYPTTSEHLEPLRLEQVGRTPLGQDQQCRRGSGIDNDKAVFLQCHADEIREYAAIWRQGHRFKRRSG
jgi:hypothetical protein